jgi:hypothetical protein
MPNYPIMTGTKVIGMHGTNHKATPGPEAYHQPRGPKTTIPMTFDGCVDSPSCFQCPKPECDWWSNKPRWKGAK